SYQRFRECGYELEPVQATNQPQPLMSLVRHGLGAGVTHSLAAHITDTTGVCVRTLARGAGRRHAGPGEISARLTAAARALLQQILRQPGPEGTEPVPDPGSE